jgi:hypothetical protein
MNLNIFSSILSLCILPIRCQWLLEKSFMRTMCGSRIGGWSLPCVMSD